MPLTLGDTVIFFESVARTGLEAPALPAIASLNKTRLTLELYEDDGSGQLPPLTTGTFSFAAAPDDNYGTCQHCMMLVGYDAGGIPKRAFYPKNGTMTVSKLSGEDLSIVAGAVKQAELVEVIQKPDLSWEVKPDGGCFYLEQWVFDTTPVDGGDCLSAEQCPNELQQICDPKTSRCAPPQCSLTFDPPFCEEGEVCLSQLSPPEEEPSGPALGACYKTCDPLDLKSCGDGFLCRPLGPTQTLGICLQQGKIPAGQPCNPSDLSSVCEGAAICSGEPGRCAPICAFLQVPSGCPDGTFCSQGNLCEPAEQGDPAAIGQPCQSTSALLSECGAEGDAFRGLCMNFFPQDTGTVCERLCRTEAPDCPSGQACLSVFSNTAVGICRAPAVCGDGALDVIGGEICDDGNTKSGDGCSANCMTAELKPLCGKTQPLTPGIVMQGDTSDGPTGYPSACDIFVATPVRTFSYLPPGPGKLTLSLSSEAGLGLSLLADCADGSSEIACQENHNGASLAMQIPAIPEKPFLVVIRGNYPFATGAFSLEATFAPEVCGDGELQGSEVCDDGNTTDGDGCSADCTSIDWSVACGGLPALTLDQPIDGSTDDGTSLFNLAGSCSSSLGSGKERAFSFTAPDAGFLELVLTQPADDFSIFAMDGCGEPTPQASLGCSNVFGVGDPEFLFVSLEKGQQITILVDGARPVDAGSFSLSAKFTPGQLAARNKKEGTRSRAQLSAWGRCRGACR